MQNLKYQKGISLIMVFFIMTIMLSVVLGISTITYSEFKNVRSEGDSIVSFYVADSGIEKTLYYSRNDIPSSPLGVTNGVCNICSACSAREGSCVACEAVGDDCNYCRKCQITYTTTFGDKEFKVLANIFPNGDFYNLDISSKGYYNKTSRAISLQIANKDLSSSVPTIDRSSLRAVRSGTGVTISATITDPDGIASVLAHIRDSHDQNDPDIANTPLERGEGDMFAGSLTLKNGPYFVFIRACDSNGNCGQSISFPIINQ
jgi:hypothetical protein